MKNKKSIAYNNIKSIGLVFLIVFAICAIVVIANGGEYKKYLGKTEIFNCMDIEEYGPDGNEEGVLKRTVTETFDYIQVYGLYFHTFYMKDETFASAKFDKLVHEYNLQNEEIKTNNNGVRVVTRMDDETVYYVVENHTTVYAAFGGIETVERNQKWFDVLRLDYKVEY